MGSAMTVVRFVEQGKELAVWRKQSELVVGESSRGSGDGDENGHTDRDRVIASQRWKDKRREMRRYRGNKSKSKIAEFMDVQNQANFLFHFKIQARVNFVLLQCVG